MRSHALPPKNSSVHYAHNSPYVLPSQLQYCSYADVDASENDIALLVKIVLFCRVYTHLVKHFGSVCEFTLGQLRPNFQGQSNTLNEGTLFVLMYCKMSI